MKYIFRGRTIQGVQPIQIALQGDNNTSVLSFVFERRVDGIDLSEYTAQLLLKGTFMPEPQEDIIESLVQTENAGRIFIDWTVGLSHAYASGTGTAQFRFIGGGGEVWQTDPFAVSVGGSLAVDETVEEQSPSVIVDHTAKILALEQKTDDTTGAFPLKESVYTKEETYSKDEIDTEKAKIAALEEETADLNTVLGYDSATAKSSVVDEIAERVEILETELTLDDGDLLRIKAIENSVSANAAAIGNLNNTKLSKQPNGSTNLINESGKISATYIPDTVLGAVKYGGTFGANGLINASSDFADIHGAAISGINVTLYKGCYFICNGDYEFYGLSFNSGDKAVCQGDTGGKLADWAKIDNTDSVTSINGKKGSVTLLADDMGFDGDYENVQEVIDAILENVIPDVESRFDAKVDKEDGKVLSTNDFTDLEKTKLAMVDSTSMRQTDLSYIRVRGTNRYSGSSSTAPQLSLSFVAPPEGKKIAGTVDWGDATTSEIPVDGGTLLHDYYDPNNTGFATDRGSDFNDFLITIRTYGGYGVDEYVATGFKANGAVYEVQWGSRAGQNMPSYAFAFSAIRKIDILPCDTQVRANPFLEIGESAFEETPLEECNFIELPNLSQFSYLSSWIRIGNKAFLGTKIKNIDLSRADHIGEFAFQGCRGLTVIECHNSVVWTSENMGINAFQLVKAIVKTNNESFLTQYLASGGELVEPIYDTEITAESDNAVASSVIYTALQTKADLVDGKIPSTQLPSYVDDALEFNTYSSLPETGESGIIYVVKDTNLQYRWSGTGYAELSKSLALGETSATAYAGDKGKTAYDHSQATGNPHGLTASDLSLGNVNNTSDADKPVSTAQQTALNTKVDVVAGKGLSTEDYTTLEKNKLFGIAEGADVSPISTDAPSDYKTYGRNNGEWVEVVSGGSGVSDYQDLTNKPIEIHTSQATFPSTGDVNVEYVENGKRYRYTNADIYPENSAFPGAYPGTDWASGSYQDMPFIYSNRDILLPLPIGDTIYVKMLIDGTPIVKEFMYMSEGGANLYFTEDQLFIIKNNGKWDALGEPPSAEYEAGWSCVISFDPTITALELISASTDASGEPQEGGYEKKNTLNDAQLGKVNISMGAMLVNEFTSDNTEALTSIFDMDDYTDGTYLIMTNMGSAFGFIDSTLGIKVQGISDYVEVHYDSTNGWQHKSNTAITVKIYKIEI